MQRCQIDREFQILLLIKKKDSTTLGGGGEKKRKREVDKEEGGKGKLVRDKKESYTSPNFLESNV